MTEANEFIIGINYWPARSAMYWWKHFDAAEVRQDFYRLAKFNFKLVRIFLTWEDFQPTPEHIPASALDNLKTVADIAYSNRLLLMPTFFCGHMSGVNWVPAWMLEKSVGKNRFPVFSNGSLVGNNIRNFYIDSDIIEAQKWQLEKVGLALKNHPAVWSYDLGNESSNCVIPPDRRAAHYWLKVMTVQLKKYGGNKTVTLGMHAEDLEEDRHLWPQDAALSCDFLCMHGYPFYLNWVSPQDVYVLPFLALVTNWLSGKPVLFQEFGLPTQPVIASPLPASESYGTCPLWTETEGLAYYNKAMKLLQQVATGALGWCYADYSPALWTKPPLDLNPHERHFGLFRHDGSPKPAVNTFMEYDSFCPLPFKPISHQYSHIFHGMDQNEFYINPTYNLRRLYQQYKKNIVNAEHPE
jgi:endo-1,4-beta-mannosidase